MLFLLNRVLKMIWGARALEGRQQEKKLGTGWGGEGASTSLLRKVESRQPEGSSGHWTADLLRGSPRRKSCVRVCGHDQGGDEA